MSKPRRARHQLQGRWRILGSGDSDQQRAARQEDNRRIADAFLALLGRGADPDEIAALFAEDLEFDIAGDVGALPWIGRKTGRGAIADFMRDGQRLMERLRFEIQDVAVTEHRAIIVGELTTRLKATGRTIESAFAIILSISGGEIAGFRMLENTFAVSQAARP